MYSLLGPDGNLLTDESLGETKEPMDTKCPKCGQSVPVMHTSLGGYWKILCNNCAHLFASGRGDTPLV